MAFGGEGDGDGDGDGDGNGDCDDVGDDVGDDDGDDDGDGDGDGDGGGDARSGTATSKTTTTTATATILGFRMRRPGTEGTRPGSIAGVTPPLDEVALGPSLGTPLSKTATRSSQSDASSGSLMTPPSPFDKSIAL